MRSVISMQSHFSQIEDESKNRNEILKRFNDDETSFNDAELKSLNF